MKYAAIIAILAVVFSTPASAARYVARGGAVVHTGVGAPGVTVRRAAVTTRRVVRREERREDFYRPAAGVGYYGGYGGYSGYGGYGDNYYYQQSYQQPYYQPYYQQPYQQSYYGYGQPGCSCYR